MVNLIMFPLSASQTPLKYQMQDFYWSHLFRPAGYTPFNVSDIVGADGMAGAVRGTSKERFLISIADYHRFFFLSSFYFTNLKNNLGRYYIQAFQVNKKTI